MSRPVVTMDARKLLHTINESAQSRVNLFSRIITEMGRKEKAEWKLSALGPKSLLFEDANSSFFTADINPKPHNRFEITNIKRVQVVEAKKGDIFRKACQDLVGSICEDDMKAADTAFTKIEACRFRSRAVPTSGMVMTKDGEVRHIKVIDNSLSEDVRVSVAKTFCEAVKDSVTLDKGRVVKGVFGDGTQKFVIPISEETRRKVVARHMRTTALNAYRSIAFQERAEQWAALVCEDKVVEAVQDAAKFLKEFQEFSLLTINEARDLVSDALAARGCFNQKLSKDIGLLMFRTSTKTNKSDILESWEKTAKVAESADLLSRIKALAESKDFETDYQKFLGHVFTEAKDTKNVRQKAYLNALKIINSVVSKAEGQEELVASMSDLIAKFERDQVDDETLYEVEDLLASISSDLIKEVERLGGYEAMPGALPEPGVEGEPEGEPEGETPEAAVELPPMGDESGEAGLEPEAGDEGGEEGGEEEAGAAEAKQTGGETKSAPTPIEKMTEAQLKEELDSWKGSHATFILEDGVEDCMHQLGRYLKRCQEVSAKPEVGLGFKAIQEMYQGAGDAIDDGDPYRTVTETHETWLGQEAPKIASDYGQQMAAQPSKFSPVSCPECKWHLGEADEPTKQAITKKIAGKEKVTCPKCGQDIKPTTEDENVTTPESPEYAGDIGMPHSNVGEGKEHSDCDKFFAEALDFAGGNIDLLIEGIDDDPEKWKKWWGSVTGGKTHKMAVCMEAAKGKGLKEPAAFCQKLASLVGYNEDKEKDGKPLTETKCPGCDHAKCPPECKCENKDCPGHVKSEDKDITDPTKANYSGKQRLEMPHSNDGEGPSVAKGGVQDPKVTDMKPAVIGGGGVTEDKDITDPSKKQYTKSIRMPHSNIGEGKCDDCGGKLVSETIEESLVAVCDDLCDVLYEAKCPECDTNLGKGGYCIKCRKKVEEDQYKWGTRRRRYGFRRAAINPLERQAAESVERQVDQIIEQMANDLDDVLKDDKDITDPTKADFGGDITMPHSNAGEKKGGTGTPKVGDATKTGQVAKGQPTLVEDPPAGQVKKEPSEATPDEIAAMAASIPEDKDITDPTKKQYSSDIEMPHSNVGEGPSVPKGGVQDPKVTEQKPADIAGGGKTAG